MAVKWYKTIQFWWHRLNLRTEPFTEVPGLPTNVQSSHKASKSVCSAELLGKSLLIAVLRTTELRSWWIPVTTSALAVSLMISNPSATAGSKTNLKHREETHSWREKSALWSVPSSSSCSWKTLKGRKEKVRWMHFALSLWGLLSYFVLEGCSFVQSNSTVTKISFSNVRHGGLSPAVLDLVWAWSPWCQARV